MPNFFFFQTLRVDNRPRLRPLPNQGLNTEFNVQADSIMRGSYPIGTIFGSDHADLHDFGNMPFYGAGQIYPVSINDDQYIVDSHRPSREMLEAYHTFIRNNNQSQDTMSYIFTKVLIKDQITGQQLGHAVIGMDNSRKAYFTSSIVCAGTVNSVTNIGDIQVRGCRFVKTEELPYACMSLSTICEFINDGELFDFCSSFNMKVEEDGAITVSNNILDLSTIFGDSQPVIQAQPAATTTTSTDPDAEIVTKSGYTQREIYTGFGSYHSNQRRPFNTPITPDKPYRMGVELELYARNSDAYNKITSARSNWFQCESDGSLNEGPYSIEMKTIPLKACDATSTNFWAAPMERLAQLAKSKNCRTTGLHVHIGKEILGNTLQEQKLTLAKLYIFYTYLVESDPDAHRKNVVICGRERGYCCNLDDSKCLTGTLIKEIGISNMNRLSDSMIKSLVDEFWAACSRERWDINLGAFSRYGTIEFRKGKGSISKTRLAALCTWWEQMCLYCKATEFHNLKFENFFNKVVSEHPCVAYFFQADEEA